MLIASSSSMEIDNYLAIRGNCSINALGQKKCSQAFQDQLQAASEKMKTSTTSEVASDDWKEAMGNPEGSFLHTMALNGATDSIPRETWSP